MALEKVTMMSCDNPNCRTRREHSKIEPAFGYHLGKGMMHFDWGGGPVPATYACSQACITPAVLHMIDETRRND